MENLTQAAAPEQQIASPNKTLGPTNALTVDVEDYYQVSAFESLISRTAWDDQQNRVDVSTRRLLEIFDQAGAKATFFTLGWVAERHPDLIRAIVDQGHELASHGYDHTRVTNLDEKSFTADVRRAKAILEDISGKNVIGYRAPTFSICRKSPWAYRVLAETGHSYSSSIYPIKRDLYGDPNAPRFTYTDQETGLLEIPLTTVHVGNKLLPCAGGGFFRLYPYQFTKWCYRKVNLGENKAAIFYTHPWEFDPDQPRPSGMSFKTRFRHYLNLDRAAGRLIRMLSDFSWGRMDEVFLADLPQTLPKYKFAA